MWVRLGAPICTKVNTALVPRILLQEALDGQESFQNSLGVVHAVDAHAHERGFDAQCLQQGRSLLVG